MWTCNLPICTKFQKQLNSDEIEENAPMARRQLFQTESDEENGEEMILDNAHERIQDKDNGMFVTLNVVHGIVHRRIILESKCAVRSLTEALR